MLFLNCIFTVETNGNGMSEKPSDSDFFSPTGQQLDVNVEMVLDENKGLKCVQRARKFLNLNSPTHGIYAHAKAL